MVPLWRPARLLTRAAIVARGALSAWRRTQRYLPRALAYHDLEGDTYSTAVCHTPPMLDIIPGVLPSTGF